MVIQWAVFASNIAAAQGSGITRNPDLGGKDYKDYGAAQDYARSHEDAAKSRSYYKILFKIILKKCGIVKSRDEGKKAMYTITNEQLSKLITNVTKTSKEIPDLCLDEECC